MGSQRHRYRLSSRSSLDSTPVRQDGAAKRQRGKNLNLTVDLQIDTPSWRQTTDPYQMSDVN